MAKSECKFKKDSNEMLSKFTKVLKSFLIVIICFVSIFPIVGCSTKPNKKPNNFNAPNETQIKLSTTEYTYETLIDDLITYCCSTSESDYYNYYLSGYSSEIKYLSQNNSVENLIDKTLIKKMQDKKISSSSIYNLVRAFPNSWDKHKKLVVYDEVYKCYSPLFLVYLQEDDKSIENKIIRTIKEKLRDPESLYMDTGEFVKYSWNLYIKCYKGDTLYYVNDKGEYTDKVYFYVKYHAKNGFGGYNSSGVWLSYSSNGYVSWTGNTGDGGTYAEYDSGYNLFGENQDLDHCGVLYVH